MPEFWNFWNFLSITVFREFGVWKFWNFLSITVFCAVKATKHCNAHISRVLTAGMFGIL